MTKRPPSDAKQSRARRTPLGAASSSKSRRRTPQENPALRVLLAALAVLMIVLLCVAANTLLPKTDPATLSLSQGTPEPEITAEPTPSPLPTVTPTPPIYAPFGAQYGHGGANLIPETPTPEPTQVPTPTPTVAPSASPARTLKKGATGQDVVRLQEALIALGYLDGSADGSFGSGTQAAVIQFQAVNALTADGLAGAKTLELLYSGNALSADEAPEMDYLLLVNRSNPLDANYVPYDLVEIADIIPASTLKVKYSGTTANRTAVEALYTMLQDAIEAGIGDWQVSSAYRTYKGQQTLVDQSVAKYKKNNPGWSNDRCLSATYQTVAPAGTSEHQTGLAFDITVPGVSFTGTKQQKWLHEHCYEYGFVVRFTESKQSITGFLAESWHFRYVGTQAAAVMTFNDWCLEEYIEKMK